MSFAFCYHECMVCNKLFHLHEQQMISPWHALTSEPAVLTTLNSSICAGILFSTLVFGPACGFILGSVCTKFYVDAIFIDVGESCSPPFMFFYLSLSIFTDSSLASLQISWTSPPKTRGGSGPGGRASSFVVPYCFALPCWCSASLSPYPKWRKMREQRASRLCSQTLSAPTLRLQSPVMDWSSAMRLTTAPPAVSSWEVNALTHDSHLDCGICSLCFWDSVAHPLFPLSLSVIPKVTKHLLSNPVFTCIVLAACMEIAVVAGFAAFLGKYLEQQFNFTTSSANQLLGKASSVHPIRSQRASEQKPHLDFLLRLKAWQRFPVRVWGSSWGACWWRSWTSPLWGPSAWPWWSTWSPPPATSPSCSSAVTRVPWQESRLPTATSKTFNSVFL